MSDVNEVAKNVGLSLVRLYDLDTRNECQFGKSFATECLIQPGYSIVVGDAQYGDVSFHCPLHNLGRE